MDRSRQLLLFVLASLASACSRHQAAPIGSDTATATSAPQSSVSAPVFGPDRPAICRATSTLDAGADKWTQFADTIPIFRGGWLYVLEGRASDAEAAIAPFNLRGTAAIECPPGRVVLWLVGVDLRHAGGGVEFFDKALVNGGLRIADAIEFPLVEGNRWRQRVCADPGACCRLLQLNCRFEATSEADVHACVREGKKSPSVQVDPSCQ